MSEQKQPSICWSAAFNEPDIPPTQILKSNLSQITHWVWVDNTKPTANVPSEQPCICWSAAFNEPDIAPTEALQSVWNHITHWF